MREIIVIGSGFAGISAATYLADQGLSVKVLEKNNMPGGRAGKFTAQGFTFDKGPSWYWMPDVFERYFSLYGKSIEDYYELIRLEPSYKVFFSEEEQVNIPSVFEDLLRIFETYEKGSGKQLKRFLEQAAYKYKVGIQQLVHQPSHSFLEFAKPRLLYDVLRMDVFCSFAQHIRKFFRHKRLLQIMEFPILFLGALPQNTPALYSLMNYADIRLGTWYPMGGMYKIVEGMLRLAEEKGVRFFTGNEVRSINCKGSKAVSVDTDGRSFTCDAVVAAADYQHVENRLLPQNKRNYSDQYWNSRVLAPSCLIFYLGINKKLNHLEHHNLFFHEDLHAHAQEIYTDPQWPSKPLFYVSCPSKTDRSVAPEHQENLFILMPVAPGLEDREAIREKYFDLLMTQLEKITRQNIRDHIIYKQSYAHRDFIKDYHSFKGNAYGLANTLMQTAFLKPKIRNKKIKNLFYTGQLTVPGPGVPPSIISGEVVAKEVLKFISK